MLRFNVFLVLSFSRIILLPSITLDFSEGLILDLDFAAGSCDMWEFFVYFHEMHELSVYFSNCVHCWRNLMKCANYYWRNWRIINEMHRFSIDYSGKNASILAKLASQLFVYLFSINFPTCHNHGITLHLGSRLVQ
jgi:hypothetical protein